MTAILVLIPVWLAVAVGSFWMMESGYRRRQRRRAGAKQRSTALATRDLERALGIPSDPSLPWPVWDGTPEPDPDLWATLCWAAPLWPGLSVPGASAACPVVENWDSTGNAIVGATRDYEVAADRWREDRRQANLILGLPER